MKKTMVIAGLTLIVLKMVYNVYTFVYEVENEGIEKAFNYCIVFFMVYCGVTYSSKGAKKIGKD